MLCLSAMTVSVVNYDNFSDCFEYRIITIIIITGVTDLLSTIVRSSSSRRGRPRCCSSGHAAIFFFDEPAVILEDSAKARARA